MAVAEASPGRLFREARQASPQRHKITERARATARVCHGCRRPRSPRLASLGNLFREARRATPQRQRASPQRQNNGARACDGAGLPWLSRKLRPSPGKLFREARRASSQRQNYGSERERRAPSEAVAEASAVAQKKILGKPDGPDPSVKTTGTSFPAARRARPKPKPSTILRIAKNGTRRAGPGFCEP